MGKKVKKQVHKIDIGVVDRPWKFSKIQEKKDYLDY